MTVPIFDIHCVSQTSYGYTKRSSTYRLPALKGRPRYRLRDSWASYIVTVQWDFTQAQYEEFRRFWYDEINAGADSFAMNLMLDDPAYYNAAGEAYTVHAIEGFDSTLVSWDFWQVRLQVEVAGGFRGGLVISCDVIYGGPITSLAPDDIYGGPIDNLAEDIIEPCPEVLGGGVRQI